MFIFPIGVVITKVLGRPGSHAPENKLGRLALEGTFQLLLCLPLAFVISRYRIDLFFPSMLLIIGGRYLTFTTLYGSRLYWACGISLSIAAFILAITHATPAMGAFTGAAVEFSYSALIYLAIRHEPSA
ncbi:hypothetical protein Q9293_05225 [Geothrix sp. PMB-07]|nr:hypothetical protein [Geothrix sp. PMB-07]WLT32734.1 hypothetical protein Q9293_05225 [Geothrix sp. PMB-07]